MRYSALCLAAGVINHCGAALPCGIALADWPLEGKGRGVAPSVLEILCLIGSLGYHSVHHTACGDFLSWDWPARPQAPPLHAARFLPPFLWASKRDWLGRPSIKGFAPPPQMGLAVFSAPPSWLLIGGCLVTSSALLRVIGRKRQSSLFSFSPPADWLRPNSIPPSSLAIGRPACSSKSTTYFRFPPSPRPPSLPLANLQAGPRLLASPPAPIGLTALSPPLPPRFLPFPLGGPLSPAAAAAAAAAAVAQRRVPSDGGGRRSVPGAPAASAAGRNGHGARPGGGGGHGHPQLGGPPPALLPGQSGPAMGPQRHHAGR